jgi:tripartite-type tricarboxylate transporter receptor subunit TctC
MGEALVGPLLLVAQRAPIPTATRSSFGNWGNFVVTGAIYSLTYDLQTAFEPISPWTTEPFIVVAKKTMAANNLRELVAWLKANVVRASNWPLRLH